MRRRPSARSRRISPMAYLYRTLVASLLSSLWALAWPALRSSLNIGGIDIARIHELSMWPRPARSDRIMPRMVVENLPTVLSWGTRARSLRSRMLRCVRASTNIRLHSSRVSREDLCYKYTQIILRNFRLKRTKRSSTSKYATIFHILCTFDQ